MGRTLSYIEGPVSSPEAGTDDKRTSCKHCGVLTFNGSFCFDCDIERNGRRYSFYASVSAEGEDSTDPRRRAQGTESYNIGLPPVETPMGTRRNGKTALHTRPITHNELPTRRAREDYAKAHGLVPIAEAPKRAIGGR